MGFDVRKSLGKIGPIRFNLSTSGIGMSAGVRGARIGVGPRGAYVTGGPADRTVAGRHGAAHDRHLVGMEAASKVSSSSTIQMKQCLDPTREDGVLNQFEVVGDHRTCEAFAQGFDHVGRIGRAAIRRAVFSETQCVQTPRCGA